MPVCVSNIECRMFLHAREQKERARSNAMKLQLQGLGRTESASFTHEPNDICFYRHITFVALGVFSYIPSFLNCAFDSFLSLLFLFFVVSLTPSGSHSSFDHYPCVRFFTIAICTGICISSPVILVSIAADLLHTDLNCFINCTLAFGFCRALHLCCKLIEFALHFLSVHLELLFIAAIFSVCVFFFSSPLCIISNGGQQSYRQNPCPFGHC